MRISPEGQKRPNLGTEVLENWEALLRAWREPCHKGVENRRDQGAPSPYPQDLHQP